MFLIQPHFFDGLNPAGRTRIWFQNQSNNQGKSANYYNFRMIKHCSLQVLESYNLRMVWDLAKLKTQLQGQVFQTLRGCHRIFMITSEAKLPNMFPSALNSNIYIRFLDIVPVERLRSGYFYENIESEGDSKVLRFFNSPVLPLLGSPSLHDRRVVGRCRFATSTASCERG